MKSAFNEHDEDNGDYGSDLDDDLLQEVVQYSSSSVDRSSIGSIPWADDAIKQNQLDWERVERMLIGEESLPSGETELRNEILEWQRKFPQLLDKRITKRIMREPSQSFDSSKTNFDLDSLSNLSLNSSEDVDVNYDDGDDFPTPTQKWQTHQLIQNEVPTPTRRAPTRNKSRATVTKSLERDFCINSVPLTLSKRQSRNAMHRTLESRNDSTSSANSTANSRRVPTVPSTPSKQVLHQQRKSPKPNFLNVPQAVERLRMPPIMNVLESKRRFCGLTGNRSFVQLTQVQQAKSAVSAPKQPIEPAAAIVFGGGRNRSAWHVPLAATTVSNRFFNNRNAIILPALNLQRIGTHHATSTIATSETVTATMTNSDSAAERTIFQHFVPKSHNFANISSTTPSSGVRSISAAVHPRNNLHAFYLPYSAAKFKSFK